MNFANRLALMVSDVPRDTQYAIAPRICPLVSMYSEAGRGRCGKMAATAALLTARPPPAQLPKLISSEQSCSLHTVSPTPSSSANYQCGTWNVCC